MSTHRPEGGWDVERVTTHPGEILREEYLHELAMSAEELSAHLKLPLPTVEAVLAEKQPVTPEIALRLSRYFRASAQFWLNLQSMHDLTRTKMESGRQIEAEIQPRAA